MNEKQLRQNRVRARIARHKAQTAGLDTLARLNPPATEYDPALWVNPELVRGVGAISPPRKYTDGRTRNLPSYIREDGRVQANMMRVALADGSTELRSARATRTTTRKRTTAQNLDAINAQDRIAHRSMADMAGIVGNIGDVE